MTAPNPTRLHLLATADHRGDLDALVDTFVDEGMVWVRTARRL